MFDDSNDVANYEDGPRLSPAMIAMRDRARTDFRYFCTTFLKIKPKSDITDGSNAGLPLIPFVFNEAQEIVWAVMQDMIRAGLPVQLVILKARQFGISTFFCAWLFWQMWRQTQYSCLIAAYQQKPTLDGLNETFNTFFESFPVGFRPKLRQQRKGGRISKDEVYFADRNAMAMFAIAKSIRGAAFDGALCTEVSHYDDPDEFFGGFVPAMRGGTSKTLIMESSAKDGFFRRAYELAKTGKLGRRGIFLPWWIVPKLYHRAITRVRGVLRDAITSDRIRFSIEERREQRALSKMAAALGRPAVTDEQMWWYQYTLATDYQGDDEYMNQEFPRDDVSCFERATKSAFRMVLPLVRDSSSQVFELHPDSCMGTLESSTYIDVMAEKQIVTFREEPKPGWIDQERRPGLFLIVPPVENYRYSIGGDVADDESADEEGDDESAYSTLCVWCAETREQVASWRGRINPHDFGDVGAMLGYFYNTAILCIERNNMGQTTEDRLTRYLYYPNMYQWPDFATGGGKLTNKIGWQTNSQTKQIMMSDLRLWCRDGLFVVRDPGLASEMANYQIKHGKYEPGPDEYADRIIAAALSIQGAIQAGYGGIALSHAVSPQLRSGAGQAARVIHSTKGKVMPGVSRTLPAEFDDLSPLHVEKGLWSAATL